jgi:hypothetical protein
MRKNLNAMAGAIHFGRQIKSNHFLVLSFLDIAMSCAFLQVQMSKPNFASIEVHPKCCVQITDLNTIASGEQHTLSKNRDVDHNKAGTS